MVKDRKNTFHSIQRTSDSLNEGLPIKKWPKKSFKENNIYSMKKILILTLELYEQVFFTLDRYLLKIWVENTVFAIQHIGNRKSFTEVLPPHPPPCDQTNPFTYSCGFTFNTSYNNTELVTGGGGRERCQNVKKQFLIKTN